jgi:hypothetical protein
VCGVELASAVNLPGQGGLDQQIARRLSAAATTLMVVLESERPGSATDLRLQPPARRVLLTFHGGGRLTRP